MPIVYTSIHIFYCDKTKYFSTSKGVEHCHWLWYLVYTIISGAVKPWRCFSIRVGRVDYYRVLHVNARKVNTLCLGFTSSFGWRPPLWLLACCDSLKILGPQILNLGREDRFLSDPLFCFWLAMFKFGIVVHFEITKCTVRIFFLHYWKWTSFFFNFSFLYVTIIPILQYFMFNCLLLLNIKQTK